MLGRMPLAPQRSAYSASKHALNALTASLRMELRAAWPDIHVSSVHPGVVATGFGSNALRGGADSRGFAGAQTAEEVADVIERPRADAYTRDGARAMVAACYAADDVGAAGANPRSWPHPPGDNRALAMLGSAPHRKRKGPPP